MNKQDLRIWFEKKGRAVYISHLDLLRTMQRALKRSGLPVWYSEGFNPRIYLSFPLALSLGVEGEREPMDLCITADISCEEFARRLDEVSPPGLRIISAAAPVHKLKDIGFAEYIADFSGDADALLAALEGFLARESINVMKHSKKKGMVEVDIKPHIEITETKRTDSGLTVSFRLPAGNTLNLNAGVFTGAFADHCAENGINAEIVCTKRTNIFCQNGEMFA